MTSFSIAGASAQAYTEGVATPDTRPRARRLRRIADVRGVMPSRA
jgi:hypothetical protein